jgi:uncharacterized pyridoxamine 5'-phosphate oxidase family protein
MNKILIIIITVLFISCNKKYTYIGQEIIDGKVSAIEPGNTKERYPTLPKIYVQDNKKTVSVIIPFSYENRWKVGDSCLLIIEKYKENE